jgi:hypothetical protein
MGEYTLLYKYLAVGEKRNSYKILVGKPDGRDHKEHLTYWEDNIKWASRDRMG